MTTRAGGARSTPYKLAARVGIVLMFIAGLAAFWDFVLIAIDTFKAL